MIAQQFSVSDTQGYIAGSFPCFRCGGTGVYATGTVSGLTLTPDGLCYRCVGKGYHTQEDRKRNYGYDMYRTLEAVEA